jgi:hypothetical protein
VTLFDRWCRLRQLYLSVRLSLENQFGRWCRLRPLFQLDLYYPWTQ